MKFGLENLARAGIAATVLTAGVALENACANGDDLSSPDQSTTTEATIATKKFTSEQFGYTLDYPITWEAFPRQSILGIYNADGFMLNPEDPTTPLINIAGFSKDDPDFDLDDYADTAAEILNLPQSSIQNGPDLDGTDSKIIALPDLTLIDYELEFEATFIQRIIIFSKEGRAFTALVSTDSENFDETMAVAEKMLDSFRVIEFPSIPSPTENHNII